MRTLCETRRDALEATVLMRLEGNALMYQGMALSRTSRDDSSDAKGRAAYDKGRALHTYGEQLARLWKS